MGTARSTGQRGGSPARCLGFTLLTGLLTGALALVAPVAGHAAAPVIDSLTAVPASVAPGGTVTVSVAAHDPDCPGTCTTGCGLYIRADLTVWGATGGTILSTDNGTSGSPYTASAVWQAPATEGSYSVSVSLSDSGTFACGGRATTVANVDLLVTSTPNSAPDVTSVTASPGRVYTTQEAQLGCTASDADGDPISFGWSTDLGTITPGAEGGGRASASIASDRPGIATVTCTATDSLGATGTGFVQVAVSDAVAERMLAKGLSVPHRLAIDDLGDVYVVDRSHLGIQVVNLFSGEPVYRLALPGVTSVAVDWARDLVIGSVNGARVIDRAGRTLLVLELEPAAGAVADVAVDLLNQRYVTLHRTSGRVIVHDASGARIAAFGTVGDGPAELRSPGGVAVAPTGEILVADGGHGEIKVFQPLTGTLVRAFGGLGAGAGTFVRLDDVEVGDDGVVWASDSFQDWIQSFDPDGTLREVLGTYGGGLGEFKTAAGLGVAGSLARLVAASANSGSVQVFRTTGQTQVVPAPGLSYSPASLFFGTRPVGLESAPRQVTLTNGGTAPLGIRNVSTLGDFAVSSACPAFLDPGASCQVAVTFTATAVGTRNGSLLLDTSDAEANGGEPVSVPLQGVGIVPGGVVLAPRILDFTDQPVGSTSDPLTVTLTNPGTMAVAIDAIGISGMFVQSNDCPRMLAGGASCTISIQFSPGGIGDHLSGVLSVQTALGTETASVEGRGVALRISSLPGSVDFGTKRLDSPPTRKVLSITNTGSDLVQIQGAAVAGATPEAFSIEEDRCTGSLLWLEDQCTVTVAFGPSSGGTMTGELRILSTAPSTMVALQGVAVDAAFAEIPTLSEWGLLALTALLALGGAMVLGRKA